MRVLILGGTAEAARLARALAAHDVEVISSLAGRTEGRPELPGEIRIGGFGGAEGLAAYLKAAAIDRLIDATHPFAARISAHAARAAALTGVPRLLLARPPWPPRSGDSWHMVADMAAAAARLPGLGRRAFLTVGIGELAAFALVTGVHCLVRVIKDQPLPLADYTLVTGKGPFAAASESALMRQHRIDVVVSKASGGAATYGKIEAARELGLPVLMVARPPPPAGERVESIEAAISWATSPAAAHGCDPARTAGNR